MIDEIVNELLVSTQLLTTNNVTRIATEIGYQPLLIMNALSEGNRRGAFKYDMKKDTIDPAEGIEFDKLALTDGTRELGNQLAILISDLNSREQDIWIKRLSEFVPGVTELQLRLAVYSNPDITEYDAQDPRDKKSIYTFITRTDNADKLWGTKQFIDPPVKAKRKAARKAAKQAESK